MNRPVISFGIPVYNGENYLDRCLASIRAQDYPQDKVEIIMADGGSTDRSVQIAEKYDVRIYDNPRRIAHWGDKLTVKHAHGELFVIFAHDNELPDRHALTHLSELFMRKPDLACCWGPMIAGPKDHSLNRYYTFIKNDPLFFFINKNLEGYLKNGTRQTWGGSPVTFFNVEPQRSLIWGANGLVYRTRWVRDIITVPHFVGDNDIFQLLIEQGHTQTAYSWGWRTIHHHIDSFSMWESKWKRDFVQHFLNLRSTRNMNWAFDRHFKIKLFAWIVYTLAFPVSLLHAIYLACRDQKIEWLWHPLAGLVQFKTYLWAALTTPQGRAFLSEWFFRRHLS